MPTDDDYGRRERLLLHQNSPAQYGMQAASQAPPNVTSISNLQSISSNINVNSHKGNALDCCHNPSAESRVSLSTDTITDRYQTQSNSSITNTDKNQSNESIEYGIRISLEKYDNVSEKQLFNENTAFPEHARSLPPCCERYNIVLQSGNNNHERLNQPSGGSNSQFSRQHQSIPNNGMSSYTLYSGTDSETHDHPRISIQSNDRFADASHYQNNSTLVSVSKAAMVSEYANSGILSLSTNKQYASETFPSPPSPAPNTDHFVPPPPLSPNPNGKYSSTHSLAGYHAAERSFPSNSPKSRDRYGTVPASPISKDRFTSVDRVLAINNTNSSSLCHDAKDHQQRYAASTERLLANRSPVLGNVQRDTASIFQVSSGIKEINRYTSSSERLVTSSPVHGSVPERFAAKNKDRFNTDSPPHDHYHRAEGSSVQFDRFSTLATCDKFISGTTNSEAIHQRYSSTEKILGGKSTLDTSQIRRYSSSERSDEYSKYNEKNDRCSTSNLAVTPEYSCRYPNYPEISNQNKYSSDHSNDLMIQRHNHSRNNDRYHDCYINNTSPTNEGRNNPELTKYSSASSTERLLITSSPTLSENSRYHNLYTSGQSSSERFNHQSPTPESNVTSRSFQTSISSKNDKFIQVSKSVSSYDRYQLKNSEYECANQERLYGIDRYGNSSGGNDRYLVSEQRFHTNSTDRYSPVTGMSDKFLSLPKPKDTYVTGKIASSCSSSGRERNENRSYGNPSGVNSYVPPNAHTPVERYVPQPPPEVLYPDRYIDRYVLPAAHTPTDRYTPASDPGDPYMRRDLGFHHHYRLPPPGYPYHQSHYRFRSFAYVSPGRLGGSPGSSSSSSSTSVQREFSTSPLLRPKLRASTIDFSSTSRPIQSCCSDGGQRSCCQVRRSLPPGALPSISNNPSSHSSWQQSPSSGTTGTSTLSSSGPDGESTQNIGMYPVGSTSSVGTTDKPAPTLPTISPSVPSSSNTSTAIAGSGPAISRSTSAPAGPRPAIQTNLPNNTSSTVQRPRIKRTMSRSEAIRNYIKKETATFFGVDEETEALEKQRWLDRRRRMASRKYGALNPEHKPPDPDITKDVPDTTELPENLTLPRWQQPVRRKDSVVRMTLSGLHYMVETLTRQHAKERSQTRPESRSFPPTVLSPLSQNESSGIENISQEDAIRLEEDEEDERFFQKPQPSSSSTAASSSSSSSSSTSPPIISTHQQSSIPMDQATAVSNKDHEISSSIGEHLETTVHTSEHPDAEELVRFTSQKQERTVIDGVQQVRRPRSIMRDHYTSRTTSWRRSRHDGRTSDDNSTRPNQSQEEEGGGGGGGGGGVGGSSSSGGVISLRRELTGGTRISANVIDRIFDNSNRRQYGMGIVGRIFGRSFRKSIAQKPHIKKQLDDIEDHRPFFTYWITTVQILVLIISLACYGFGPIGLDLNHRSGLVLVTSLSLQQVDYQEPANFWIGPRAADLIHLGAKFAPCMRRDVKILKEIDVWRERERDTACCIRNDDSGCVQSSKAECSNTISTWKKWSSGESGPGGRISGSVCGLDPKFCDAPASIAPYEWPDDITKWPICRKTNPSSQKFRIQNGHLQSNSNFPIERYKDKMAEHMVCEVIGHPCCIGIHGTCRITTKEYCDFVHGYFHEEASLCSQIECLHDVCGMIPFLHPEWPDQFYRLFTTTFLHAGILHLAITLLVQYYLMRDLEKLTGSLRIAIIYFTGALAGNLASAIFIPYRAEVGPAGAHFALFATLVVEVLNSWPMLKHPRHALAKLIFTLIGFLILGVLPWVDNYAHLFGFIFGFLISYAVMPFISFGHYDRQRKIILIWICIFIIIGLFTLLLTLFYNVPLYDCEICKLFNCIPFTRDFCASQNINFKREEPV